MTAAKPHVLFHCTHNAARSQIAEAMLRQRAGERMTASSAGLVPTEIHPHTVRVLSEIGLETNDLRPKSVQEFLGKARIDYAVFVCDRAESACPRLYPFALHALSWPFDDPVRPDEAPELNLARFRRLREESGERLGAWLPRLNLRRR